MSYTVGLDFGTHQTKVCIEDASNPAQKMYEFLEFNNPNGESAVLLPSVVQINQDDTVSYGFVDEKKCKWLNNEGIEKPKLKLLPKPDLKLPEEPEKPIFPSKPIAKTVSWKDKLKGIIYGKKKEEDPDVLLWKNNCSRIQDEYELIINNWKRQCAVLQENHTKEIDSWKADNILLETKYSRELEKWGQNGVEGLSFRYFKLATFSSSDKWNQNINSDVISVWYIANILFVLQTKLGEDFFVQIGVPSGTDAITLKEQKNKAFAIMTAAYKLVDHYDTKESFLSEKYSTLLELTEIEGQYSEDDVIYYGLNVVPEAYAGLSSITQQKRLETGMSLLVDIGGGTTDVAFFTISDDKPDIHMVISFPKGLNFIFEQYISSNKELSFVEVQRLFFEKKGENLLFGSSIVNYQAQLSEEVKRLVKDIQNSFSSRKNHHQLPVKRLMDALDNRPVVYCGGGSIYKSMRTALLNFTDQKLISKNLLNIPFVNNHNIDDELFTILATSYGLSIPLENEIVLTPIEKVFNHIAAPDLDQNDYGYKHGLSDF
tara:strand:+ start:1028 stop:2656 length:1629 start_codon:yes stop_codon:yes gene_type:complete